MKKLFLLIFIITIPLFAEDKPQMTCQPMDVKITNVPKETSDMMNLNNKMLTAMAGFANLRCESKEAICFLVGNAISCIKK